MVTVLNVPPTLLAVANADKSEPGVSGDVFRLKRWRIPHGAAPVGYFCPPVGLIVSTVALTLGAPALALTGKQGVISGLDGHKFAGAIRENK